MFRYNTYSLLACLLIATPGLAAPLPTLDYTASFDPDGGADALWEDAATPTGGHDFELGAGVTYNGSPLGAPSGVTAVYSFTGAGTAVAKWGTGNNAENTPAGNLTTQSASFEIIFRANTDNSQDILWDLGGSGRGASMTINNTTLQFAEQNTGNVISAAISAGEFYHAVGTLDFTNDQMKLYVNGGAPITIAYAGTDWAGTDGGTDGALGGKNGDTVGGQTTANGIGSYGTFNGDIASFRIYQNTVLTQGDVQELAAAAGIPEPSSLALLGLGGLLIGARRRRG